MEDKINGFQKYIIKLRQTHNFPLSQIGNMDEVKITGNDETRFIVILTCMADGTKLKPMIIFKRKLIRKIKFPLEVFVHVNEKG